MSFICVYILSFLILTLGHGVEKEREKEREKKREIDLSVAFLYAP